jgi:hypothetical protein
VNDALHVLPVNGQFPAEVVECGVLRNFTSDPMIIQRFLRFSNRSGSIPHFFLPRNTAKRVLAALARTFADRRRDLVRHSILLPIYSTAENYDNRLPENARIKNRLNLEPVV